jgi:arginine-tRNA-protein transferase
LLNSIEAFAMADRSLVLVHDQPQPCPYLPGYEARMPLHWPTRQLSPEELDRYMASGYRRSGVFLYHTRCPSCRACEPTRVEVERFAWTRSLRRVLRRGDATLSLRSGPPATDRVRLALINQHRAARNLAQSGTPLDHEDYRSFLIDTCCDTRELSYWADDRLVAVAVTDFGRESLSAVYCYFDPEAHRLSPGTYSILKQLQLAAESGRRYLYLGMYVESNRHLSYKSRFQPQERLIEGRWQPAGDSRSTPVA